MMEVLRSLYRLSQMTEEFLHEVIVLSVDKKYETFKIENKSYNINLSKNKIQVKNIEALQYY